MALISVSQDSHQLSDKSSLNFAYEEQDVLSGFCSVKGSLADRSPPCLIFSREKDLPIMAHKCGMPKSRQSPQISFSSSKPQMRLHLLLSSSLSIFFTCSVVSPKLHCAKSMDDPRKLQHGITLTQSQGQQHQLAIRTHSGT
jgi:hypothetical protein